MMRCVQLLAVLAVCSGEALLHAPDGVNQPNHPSAGAKAKTQQLAKRQMKDSHFMQPTGETYSNHAGRFFSPAKSSTFSLIKLDNVNVTFLDNTNLRGNSLARARSSLRWGLWTGTVLVLLCQLWLLWHLFLIPCVAWWHGVARRRGAQLPRAHPKTTMDLRIETEGSVLKMRVEQESSVLKNIDSRP